MEERLPAPGSGKVLVRTTSGAVSVGSELPAYTGEERRSVPPEYPRMTGYENVGAVVELGSDTGRFSVGDRVVGFYGHRTHAVVSERRLIPVPDGVSDALALLVILTCDVSKGIRKLLVKPEEHTLATGAGAIGLLTLAMLRAYGVSAVDVVEPDAHRRAKAADFGARRTMNPEEAVEDPTEYPVGFECSSRDAAFRLLQRKLRSGGRVCILSDGNIEGLSLAPDFHEKELSVVGSSDGWSYEEHADWYFDLVLRDDPLREKLESLFELRVSVDELPGAFESLARRDVSPIKVLVEYGR